MVPVGLSVASVVSLVRLVRPSLVAFVFAAAAAGCPPQSGTLPEPPARRGAPSPPANAAAPLADARGPASRASGGPALASAGPGVTVARATGSSGPSTADGATQAAGARHASEVEADSRPLAAEAARPAASRFFFAGDGAIEMENGHTGENLRIRFRDQRGRYDATAVDRIDAFFRSRGDGRRRRVALRLIELIDYLQDRARPAPLVLLSGYRSGEYNAAVIARGGQAARASMHTEGLAADLHFAGVDHRALWLEVRELGCCGAGYYASGDFLHLDVGRPRFWEETTSRVKENLSRGNARLIARTDYDRYDRLDGAEIGVYAVTLLPLRVARVAELVTDGADAPPLSLRLDRASGATGADDASCLEFALPSRGAEEEPIELRVAEVLGAGAPAPAGAPAGAPAPRGASPAALRTAPLRGRVVVHTCEPRLEATPERIETNPIEVGAAPAG